MQQENTPIFVCRDNSKPLNVPAVDSLADRLKELRRKAGLTQMELARKAKVSQQTISNIERGRVRSARDLVKIAKALNITADYLAGAENNDFVREIYDLIMTLPPDRREDVLVMLRTLAKR